MDVITAALDIGHTLDEFRCYLPSRMQGELATIDHTYAKNKNCRDLWELAKFNQKAVRTTGDRVMAELSGKFSQRKVAFSFGDTHALIHRNSFLTDPARFKLCSQSAIYCWNLLEKIPSPISYSKGETTYTYVIGQAPQKVVRTTEEALKLISQGRGLIRLVNTQTETFGFEMTMLNDPVYFRPTRDVGEKNRGWAPASRIARSRGDVSYRGFKKRLPLAGQISTSCKKSKAVHKEGERGLPKLTKFTKKLSLTLLRPDGRIKHFTGEFPKEYGSYKPVGFLYDAREVHKKGEKYVFDKDVSTSSKFWLGADASRRVYTKEGRTTKLTLHDLQTQLREEAKGGRPPQSLPFYKMQHAANEVLMAPRKSALQAVFSTEDTAAARLRTFLHAVYLAQDYGMQVPVLVVDGTNPPKGYTAAQLEADIASPEGRREVEMLYDCFFSQAEREKRDPLNLFTACTSYLIS